MLKILLIVTLLISCLSFSLVHAQDKGRLEEFADDVDADDDDDDEADDDDSDDEAVGAIIELFFDLLLSSGDYEPSWYYTDYPYKSIYHKFAVKNDDDYSTHYATTQLRFQQVSSSLHNIGFDFKTKWNTIFGVDFGLSRYWEDRRFGAGTDNLWMVSGHLNFLLARNESFLLEIMPIGFRAIQFRDVAWAYDLGLSAQVFPVRPLVLDASFSVGIFGNGKPVYDYRFGAGVFIDRVEINFGYRVTQSDNVFLNGPEIGIRIWY